MHVRPHVPFVMRAQRPAPLVGAGRLKAQEPWCVLPAGLAGGPCRCRPPRRRAPTRYRLEGKRPVTGRGWWP
jgi:hypothetical protein